MKQELGILFETHAPYVMDFFFCMRDMNLIGIISFNHRKNSFMHKEATNMQMHW